jgi:hypothetical protein
MSAQLLEYVRIFRIVWFRGRMGGGKTALAVATAEWLLAQGLSTRVVSNIELRGFGPQVGTLEEDEVHYVTDAAILFDESWMGLGDGMSKDNVRSWLAQLRHRRQYLLLPSVLDLIRPCDNYTVERVWNGPAFGLPLWIYQYQVGKGRKAEVGKFYWWRPGAIFKRYDHLGEPGQWRIYEP